MRMVELKKVVPRADGAQHLADDGEEGAAVAADSRPAANGSGGGDTAAQPGWIRSPSQLIVGGSCIIVVLALAVAAVRRAVIDHQRRQLELLKRV